MIVIDTSAWIEYFEGSEIGRKIRAKIEQPQNCVVPTLVQFELIKWMRRERGEAIADAVLAYTQICIVQPLDTPIAMAAADLATTHRLSAVDSVIFAIAQLMNAELLTCDAHFDGLPGVQFISKKRT